MANINLIDRLHDAIENYYRYNPDTLMPLLMVALAAQGKLKISTNHSEGAQSICEMDLNKIKEYDWVRHDPPLRKRIKGILDNGDKILCAEGFIVNDLKGIYDTFYRYDNFTVDEEFHHKVGILYHHSNNRESDQAHRQYATLCLAEALVETPVKCLQNAFLEVSHYSLVKSGLQPERPRLRVAEALCSLLQYDGKGKVYNPFAGCGVAAAMIQAGENLYADGNDNDKLFAVANLLTYGMGGSTKHMHKHDSKEWTKDGKFDYIMSTYRGYINGKSAFDFCLEKSFDTLSEQGKFAGIVAPKDIFEHQSEEMKEALKRDWVDTIILLPFGEVAVLINAAKDFRRKGLVYFYNLTHPMRRRKSINIIFTEEIFADVFKVSDVKKKNFLRNQIVHEMAKRDGFKIVNLSDYICAMPRKTYSLSRVALDNRVLACIDSDQKYDQFQCAWMQGIIKEKRVSLFAPAYYLNSDCLITNTAGMLDPRLFDSDSGNAFFQDGYAFKLKKPAETDFNWLIKELNESYVLRQLHPYGMDKMVPEAITEQQILGLKLYKEIEYDFGIDSGEDLDSDKLPMGEVLKGEHTEYTIHHFLGHGSFGYAYSALAHNTVTGEQREVVLKEFYPCRWFHREGKKAIINNESMQHDVDYERKKFCEEAKIMRALGTKNDSHIVPANELFKCEETGTMYYVMPFYHDGSLEDLQNNGHTFTEEMTIKQVVIPLCKALHVAHEAKVLHLDIKPENILVDENGDAILIDFGVAKQYDDQGDIIYREGLNSASMFAAPELKYGNMVKFGSQTDIYGLAATIYYLIAAPKKPMTVYDFSDANQKLIDNMTNAHCSEQFAKAVVAGLHNAATSRPANAQEFLNLFPRCENIKL